MNPDSRNSYSPSDAYSNELTAATGRGGEKKMTKIR